MGEFIVFYIANFLFCLFLYATITPKITNPIISVGNPGIIRS